MKKVTTNRERVEKLLNRTNIESPSAKDVQALRNALQESPELWKYAGDLAEIAAQNIFRTMKAAPAIIESLRVGWVKMREDLYSNNLHPLEKLLIDQVVLCWIRVYWADICADYNKRRRFEDQRLNAAQRRFLRAIETLVKVQKMLKRSPVVQLNIATNGGQQVNMLKSEE